MIGSLTVDIIMGNLFTCPTALEVENGKLSLGTLLGNVADPNFAIDCDALRRRQLSDCVSTFAELACAAADTDKIEVCPGSVIDFDTLLENVELLSTGMTIQLPDGAEITCPTCDCLLRRPYFSLFYSLCPFFTTQLGNEVKIEGFVYGSGFDNGSDDSFDFASRENIISFSNYEDNFESDQVDIEVDSKFQEAKSCSSKGGKGSKGSKGSKGTRHLQNSARSPRTRGQRGQRVLQGSDNCSSATNPLVKEFQEDDLDNDGILTCSELQGAVDTKMPGAGTAVCPGFFASMAMKECFELDSNGDLTLANYI